MFMPTKLRRLWLNDKTSQRFGQWFISHYIKEYDVNDSWWQLLWNTPSIEVAGQMITNWCIDNQYVDSLPPRVR